MRSLIYTAFVSLDGVVDSPGGGTEIENHRSGGWTYQDLEFVEEAYEIKGREQEEATAMMLGRVSYQSFAPVWPEMAEFARYNAMPKYVVSTTLTDADLVDNWGDTTILRSLDEVAAVRSSSTGAPPSPATSPTPVSSTATTCSFSLCCWGRGSGCSARPTSPSRCSGSSRATPIATGSRSWSTKWSADPFEQQCACTSLMNLNSIQVHE